MFQIIKTYLNIPPINLSGKNMSKFLCRPLADVVVVVNFNNNCNTI